MTKTNFVFTKEMGLLLKKFRMNVGLSQSEVGERIGFSKKSAYSQISHLENGLIKNPSLGNIILYLKACGVAFTTFFQKLSEIDFKIEHKNIMRQVGMPSGITSGLRQKIDRDTAKYVNKIRYPKTPFQRLDWERVKTKIDKKVKILLFNHELDENSKAPYFTFAKELILNYDTGQTRAIFEKYWQIGQLKSVHHNRDKKHCL
jgi:transcriptional regulator with XRE-family HTH domain